MTARRAFTLTEILVAIMIFTIVSMAMIGIFNSATRLFQSGQRARAANDEAMTILSRLDFDCAAAIGPDAGGRFYSWIDDNGNAAVGWTVRRSNPRPEQAYIGFVIYGVNGNQLRRREVEIDNRGYPRVLLDTGALNNSGFSLGNPLGILDDSDPDDTVTPQAIVLSDACYHFGVWLVGTSHAASGGTVIATQPSDNADADSVLSQSTYWHYVCDSNADPSGKREFPAEPSGLTGPDELNYYTNLDAWANGITPRYPDTIRFSLVLGGAGSNTQEGRLLTISGERVSVRGLHGVVASPGSVLRIGSPGEWVGVHQQDSSGFIINTSWEHGPLGPDGNGRAALRSLRPNNEHETGAPVVTGRCFSLVKRLRL